MTATAQQLKLAFGLTPERAIEYFRAKDIRITRRAHDMAASAHARAFTVAGVTKAEVLQDIRDAMDTALAEGQTYAQFVQNLRPILQKRGWWGTVYDPETGEILPGRAMTPYRLETIYRANMQSAYMAGRYKAQLENADARPYWTYVAVMDDRTRGSHAAMHNRTFRYDDPVWQVWYPPCGYRCRCRVVARSAAEVKADGITLSSGENSMETRTLDLGKSGKISLTGYTSGGKWLAPAPGFDSNPGWGAYGTDMALARRVQALKSPDLRQQVWAALNGSAKRKADYIHWVNHVLSEGYLPTGSTQVIGFVDEEIAAFMLQLEPDRPPVRVVTVNDRQLRHMDREAHKNGGIALNREQYMMLSEIIARPDAIYHDRWHNNFAYVSYLADGSAIYLPVRPNDAKRKMPVTDAAITAYCLPNTNNGIGRLKDRKRFTKMGGSP